MPATRDAGLAALPGRTRVVAHCKAGLGRTGTALACALAARHGWDAGAALARCWEKVALARAVMETYGQAAFVCAYAASKRGSRAGRRRARRKGAAPAAGLRGSPGQGR